MRFIYFLSLASPIESKNTRQGLFTKDHTRFNRRRSTLEDAESLSFKNLQNRFEEQSRKIKIMHKICTAKSCLKCHKAIFDGVDVAHCNAILNLNGCCKTKEFKHFF